MFNFDYALLKHSRSKTILESKKVLDNFFPKTDKFYEEMNFHEFREICAKAQDELNKKKFTKKIINEISDVLFDKLGTMKILIQSNLYLRASRKSKINPDDYIDFHRESFYGSGLIKCLNIWTPIRGVNNKNTLNFIPGSHHIRNKDIKINKKRNMIVEKFSNAHKTGLLYKPAKIKKLGNLKLSDKQKMKVPYFSSSLFEGQLIHGAAKNTSDEIRFSVDFRIIRKSDYKSKYFKKKKFASNKSYFEEFRV